MADTQVDPNAAGASPAGTPAPTPPAPTPPAPAPEGEPASAEEAQALFASMAAEADKEAAPPKRTRRRTGKAPDSDDEDESFSGQQDGAEGTAAATPAPTPAPTPPAPAAEKPNIPAAPAPGFTAEEIDALRQLPAMFKVMGGRLGQMQSALSKGNAAAEAAGADSPDAAALAAAGKDTKKWNKLKADFPEWAEGIEEAIGAVRGTAAPAVDMSPYEARLAASDARVLQAENELKVVTVHGNWRPKIKTPQFTAFYNAQSEEERRRIYVMNDPDEIIATLDKFEKYRQQSGSSAPASPAADRGQAQVDPELAAAVNPRGASRMPKKTLADMSDKEYWDHEAREADKQT